MAVRSCLSVESPGFHGTQVMQKWTRIYGQEEPGLWKMFSASNNLELYREKRRNLNDSRNETHEQNEGQKCLATFPMNIYLKKISIFPKLKFFVRKFLSCFSSTLMAPGLQHPLILNFLLLLFPNTLWTLKTWGGKQAGTISKIYFGCLKLLFVGGTRKITIQRKFHFVVSFPPNNFPSLFGKGTIWRSECFICCWSQK